MYKRQTKTDCTSNFDRCSTATANGVITTACTSESILKAAGLPGDGCKKVLVAETCACKSDYCNDPSKKSSASSRSEFQLFAMLVLSCVMKILLA